jgi:hypothetical protein
MDEPDQQSERNQLRLSEADGLEQREVRLIGAGRLRVMTGDHVISQEPKSLNVSAGCEELKSAHSDMALCDASENRTWQQGFSRHSFARQDGCKRARSRNAQSGHCFADDILAQDWAKRGPAITPTGKWGWTRALQLDVTPHSLSVYDLSEQDRAPVA